MIAPFTRAQAIAYSRPRATAPELAIYRAAGAYPQRSNATSGAAGSLWFQTFGPTGTSQRVWLTQWDALLRRFQRKAVRLLPTSIRYSDDGGCAALADPHNAQAIQRAAITVDGIWGPQTSRVLQWIMCATGAPERADRIAVERQLHRISLDTVQDIAWFVTQLSAMGTPESPAANYASPAVDVNIPADTILPGWSTRVTSSPADAEWLGSYVPDAQNENAPPLPPSQGGPPVVPTNPTPVPPPTHSTEGNTTDSTPTRAPVGAAAPGMFARVPLWGWGLGAAAVAVVAVAATSGGKTRASGKKKRPRGTTTRTVTKTTTRR